MSELADKLNEILADEWACVRALRRAETLCAEPGLLEVIKRVRRESSVQCVSLANVVRAHDGRPTDLPSPRFSLQLKDEAFDDALNMAQSAQEHVVAEMERLLDEPTLGESRAVLTQAVRLHRDNIRWLATAAGGQR